MQFFKYVALSLCSCFKWAILLSLFRQFFSDLSLFCSVAPFVLSLFQVGHIPVALSKLFSELSLFWCVFRYVALSILTPYNLYVCKAIHYYSDWSVLLHYCIVFIHFSRNELFRNSPDHSNWHCVGVYTPKRYRQLQVKDLPKVSTWRLERDWNPRPFGRKAATLPMHHHAPHNRR